MAGVNFAGPTSLGKLGQGQIGQLGPGPSCPLANLARASLANLAQAKLASANVATLAWANLARFKLGRVILPLANLSWVNLAQDQLGPKQLSPVPTWKKLPCRGANLADLARANLADLAQDQLGLAFRQLGYHGKLGQPLAGCPLGPGKTWHFARAILAWGQLGPGQSSHLGREQMRPGPTTLGGQFGLTPTWLGPT